VPLDDRPRDPKASRRNLAALARHKLADYLFEPAVVLARETLLPLRAEGAAAHIKQTYVRLSSPDVSRQDHLHPPLSAAEIIIAEIIVAEIIVQVDREELKKFIAEGAE
jgi:hypothetical protein